MRLYVSHSDSHHRLVRGKSERDPEMRATDVTSVGDLIQLSVSLMLSLTPPHNVPKAECVFMFLFGQSEDEE